MNSKEQILHDAVERLSEGVGRRHRRPSVARLAEAVALIKALIFPEFFDDSVADDSMRRYAIGVNADKLYAILCEQIARVGDNLDASALALEFISELPELRRVLLTDVDAVYANDPAVDNRGEVIFSYPVVHAMVHYRTAHALLLKGVPVIPRIITELAHSATGIDIHPGATIGEYFAIDHGTGVVIGQTCIIGNHVTLYQGVTLGSKNFEFDDDGHPLSLPRHPIIEDGVTIYSNASVLGRITIGRNAVIGGNVWVTTNVAPGAKIVQKR
ncbi:MAG: serine acetyltransferase [Muribaculaceae bacterium]|nr:serine acetyltransferase [Muribaculaceae bacterium]